LLQLCRHYVAPFSGVQPKGGIDTPEPRSPADDAWRLIPVRILTALSFSIASKLLLMLFSCFD
jgi:hypothetical protein